MSQSLKQSQNPLNLILMLQNQNLRQPKELTIGESTPFFPEIGGDLIFELKPDGSFLGKASMETGNDLIGSWKVEGELLICEGTTEKSSQIIVFKFNKSTKKWISVSADGEEESIEDAIPEGEDGLYLKKN